MMVMCDLPCDAPSDISCTSYSASKEKKPKDSVRLQPGCACPDGYTQEVQAKNVLTCTRRLVCSCSYHGNTYTVRVSTCPNFLKNGKGAIEAFIRELKIIGQLLRSHPEHWYVSAPLYFSLSLATSNSYRPKCNVFKLLSIIVN